jgi:hypothetical protein
MRKKGNGKVKEADRPFPKPMGSYDYKKETTSAAKAKEKLLKEEFLDRINETIILKFRLAGKINDKYIIVPYKLQHDIGSLGEHSSALDSIRMDCRSYIITKQLDYTNNWFFLIFGRSEELMKLAARRLQDFQKNVAADDPRSEEFYLIKPVKMVELREQLFCKDHEPENSKLRKNTASANSVFVYNKKSVMSCDAWEEFRLCNPQSANISEMEAGSLSLVDNAYNLNCQYLNHIFNTVMNIVPAYRGSLIMKVAIGTCVFDRIPNLPEDKDFFDCFFIKNTFEERNRDSNLLLSHFPQELGATKVERNLLNSFKSSNKFELFHHDFSTIQSLYPEPSFSVSFTFTNPIYAIDENYLVLTVSFPTVSSTGNVEWFFKHDLGKEGQVLDINVIDFEHTSCSYNLSVQRTFKLRQSEIDQIPNQYRKFASGIHLSPYLKDSGIIGLPTTGGNFFDTTNLKHLNPLQYIKYERSKTWRYQFACTSYQVEVSMFQIATMDWKEPKHPISYYSPPRWSINVTHPNWVANFNQNQNLNIGQVAKWKGREDHFFLPNRHSHIDDPKPVVFEKGSGFKELLRVLDGVVEVVLAEPLVNVY